MKASYCQNLTLLSAILVLMGALLTLNKAAYASLPIEADNNAAVILVYQKFDNSYAPDTSLSEEKFSSHINELTSGSYSVLPLSTILDNYKNGTALPAHSVAITFDGTYRSAYEKAFPILIKQRIPFTIFISPQLIDSARPETLTWDELRELARKHDFIEFGLHPFIYTRLTGQDKKAILKSLIKARESFEEHMSDLRDVPSVFAYPFGAFTKEYREAVIEAGFEAALTQSSGVSYSDMDLYQLPRFTLTDTYGAIERFRMIVNAAPLPLYNWKPDSFTLRESEAKMHQISFEAAKDLNNVDQLSCFVSGQDQPAILSTQAEDSILVTLELKTPMESGRTRINCTMPGPPAANILDTPIYRWHGMLYDLE